MLCVKMESQTRARSCVIAMDDPARFVYVWKNARRNWKKNALSSEGL